MSRRVLLALLSAAVLVGLLAQPGAAVNVPQAAVVSANPADWTPHVLDGKVDAVVQVGNKMVAGGVFTRVANAATPTTAIGRSNIFAFDATTGVVDTAFAPVLDGEVESLARVTDMATSGGRLYIGGTFKTADGVATPLALKGVTSTQFPISRITGMLFWNGRLYYTLSGDTRLHYRWFTPQSGTSAPTRSSPAAPPTGRNWSTVNGMTMACGRLLYATTSGTLSTVDFSGSLPSGTPTTIGGPALDGRSWQSRALLVLNPPA